MLYGIQPDRSVTGGSWYTDQDFDSQFVDTLIMMCHRFLEQKVPALISHYLSLIYVHGQLLVSLVRSLAVWLTVLFLYTVNNCYFRVNK